MGVMTCNRRGCNNIMCDRYSDEYGYICSECFEELCNRPEIKITEFMNKRKRKQSTNKEAWYKYIDAIFE